MPVVKVLSLTSAPSVSDRHFGSRIYGGFDFPPRGHAILLLLQETDMFIQGIADDLGFGLARLKGQSLQRLLMLWCDVYLLADHGHTSIIHRYIHHNDGSDVMCSTPEQSGRPRPGKRSFYKALSDAIISGGGRSASLDGFELEFHHLAADYITEIVFPKPAEAWEMVHQEFKAQPAP
jgi:hypothetical protein